MSVNELTVRLGNEGKLLALPAVVWNEEEVAQRLEEMLAAYQGRQYTAGEIKGAKADRAAVNKIEKMLADAQREVTALYKEPVAEFSEKMKLYREKTKQVSAAIDAQIKAVEQAAREDKRSALQAVYAAGIGDELKLLVPFEKLEDPRWLNASTPMATAQKELLTRIETCRQERETLRDLCGDDFAEIDRVYLERLSIREAMAAHKRLLDTRAAQAAAEQARRQAKAAAAAAPVILRPTQTEREIRSEAAQRAADNQIITGEGRLDFSQMNLQQFAQPAEEPKPYDFRAWLTRADITALKAFFESRSIRYGKVQ